MFEIIPLYIENIHVSAIVASFLPVYPLWFHDYPLSVSVGCLFSSSITQKVQNRFEKK